MPVKLRVSMWLVRTAILGLLVFVVGMPATRVWAQDLVIAVAGPMTGNYAQYGKFMRTNVELAAQQVNAKGGINGRKIQVVVEDDGMDPKQAPVVAQRLTLRPEVLAVVGHFSSTTCLAAVPIYDRGKLVVISPSATSPDLAGSSPYWFRILVTDQEVSVKLGEYAADKLKAKRLAILYAQAAGAISQAEWFEETLKRKGGEIILKEPHEIGTKDFTAVLTKVAGLKPDLIFFPAYIAEGAPLVRQARELGYKGALMGTDAMYTPELPSLAGAAADGVYAPAFFHPADSRPEARAYVEAYRAKYGELPEAYGANSYDAANLIFEAIRKGGATREAIQKYMDGVGTRQPAFAGVTGSAAFDAKHNVTKPLSVAILKGGQWELVK